MSVRCDHCGRASHGFACCGQVAAEARKSCSIGHHAAEPEPAAGRRDHCGPPQRMRAPKRLNPTGAR